MRIIYFVDREDGRDIEMFLPLYYYFKEHKGWDIRMTIFYDAHQIKYYKPDIVFLPNTIGAEYYYLIGKLCKERDITLFAMESEGNFRVDGKFMHWGYNLGKEYYQDWVTQWSIKARDYLKEKEPKFADKIVCTGNPGIDRYKIYDFLNRDEFLRKRNKEGYKYVVGYAAWAFGKIYYDEGYKGFLHLFEGDESKIPMVERQRKEVEAVLEHAIVNNPDTLFILKVHPLERKLHEEKKGPNECDNLEKYDNVIIEYDDYDISHYINVCDLWLSFESTTCVEAWLMNKETAIIRTYPEFSEYIRASQYDISQPLAENGEQLDAFIKEVKETGTLSDFYLEKYSSKRDELVNSVFGFSDGLNHLRVIKYFMKSVANLKNRKPVYKTNFRFWLLHYLIAAGRIFMMIPGIKNFWKFKKFKWVFSGYSFANFDKYYYSVKPSLDQFYKENNLIERIEKENLLDELTKVNE